MLSQDAGRNTVDVLYCILVELVDPIVLTVDFLTTFRLQVEQTITDFWGRILARQVLRHHIRQFVGILKEITNPTLLLFFPLSQNKQKR